jgi:hypothetical protein
VPKKVKNEPANGAAYTETKPARRARSTSSKKKAAAKSPKPRKTKFAAAAAIEPTDEEIRIRAYFIAERRHRFDLEGDADSDWLEAKRQLLSELGPR